VLLQGMDHKLGNGPVGVSDIRLGMADTPMTAHLPASPLKISPGSAAATIVAGLEKRRSVYLCAVVLALDHAGDSGLTAGLDESA